MPKQTKHQNQLLYLEEGRKGGREEGRESEREREREGGRERERKGESG